MKTKGKYNWKFCTIGGVTRVMIQSGEDIAHLGELDKKLWTVLSCPVDGLEMDPVTLNAIDTDKDGKIRVDEVVRAADWLTTVLKDPALLLKKESELPLSAIDDTVEQGALIKSSALQILSNLGLQKESISVADSSDSVAVFAKSALNGDGVVTLQSTDDEELKSVISAIISTLGPVADRSGLDGVDSERIEKFYELCEKYAAWSDAAGPEILPYGEDTEAALAACEAVREKTADYFMRCALASFDADSISALDVSVERIAAISAQNLSGCKDEIASYPLARVTGEPVLPYSGINPAWQDAFSTLRANVLDKEYPDAVSVSEEQWKSVLAKLDAYAAWKAAKAGAEVETLGIDAVKAFLMNPKKDALLQLVADDLALKPQADSIDAVSRFLHLYRDFYSFLGNYVTFNDFYARSTKALFQAGKLYIDQRCCGLCMKVKDMGASVSMAGLSGMYLVYCTCTSKVKGGTMNILAAITQGDVNDLRPGKHAVFYDREGCDWDATVVNIIENPISIGQAFWSPYRKLSRLVEDRVAKTAAEKSSKVSENMSSKVESAQLPSDQAAAKKAPFDIAKFTGILAAAGLAFSAILAALGVLAKSLAAFKWWQLLIVVAVVLLVISGPSMVMAYLKLRKRSISPLLNANGWAMNSRVGVNIRFGNTLTTRARLPKLAGKDPFGTPAWVKWLTAVLVLAAVAVSYLALSHRLPWQKEQAEQTMEETVVEASDSTAVSPADALSQ